MSHIARMDESATVTVSTKIATPPKSTKSRNSNSSVQIQTDPKSENQFVVMRDSEEYQFFDLVISGV